MWLLVLAPSIVQMNHAEIHSVTKELLVKRIVLKSSTESACSDGINPCHLGKGVESAPKLRLVKGRKVGISPS